MHFAPSISDTDLPQVIQKTVAIGTPRAWKHRIAQYELERQRNPFVVPYYAERHALEIAMDRIQKHKRVTGRLPDIKNANAETHGLFAFAGMLVNVYERISPRAQNALAGRVRGGLLDDTGLAPVAFELLIASHLMEKGADVEWHDLESGGFDFIARHGPVEVEVECKTFSADVGRKIHRRRLFQLGSLIHGKFKNALARHGSLFVSVSIEGHLAGQAIGEVAGAVSEALKTGRDTTEPRPCAIAIHRLSAAEMLFGDREISQTEVIAFVQKRFNQLNPSLLLFNKPGQGTIILGIRSAKSDDVVRGMYEQLKRGSFQFSGTRPGLLCAHFLDLTPAQLLDLHAAQERGEPSALNLMAARLFSSNRPFLHTVQYSVPGLLQETQTQTDNLLRRHFRESGPAYAFVNQNHPLANNPNYLFFL